MLSSQKNDNSFKYWELSNDISNFASNYFKIISIFSNSHRILRLCGTVIKVYYARHRCYNNLDKLAKFLKKNTIFSDEYFIFLEIRDISKYILDKKIDSIKIEELDIMQEFSFNFFILLQEKLEILLETNWELNEEFEAKFKVKRDLFYERFNSLKKCFYDSIYHENDDNLIIEYCKIIGE